MSKYNNYENSKTFSKWNFTNIPTSSVPSRDFGQSAKLDVQMSTTPIVPDFDFLEVNSPFSAINSRFTLGLLNLNICRVSGLRTGISGS